MYHYFKDSTSRLSRYSLYSSVSLKKTLFSSTMRRNAAKSLIPNSLFMINSYNSLLCVNNNITLHNIFRCPVFNYRCSYGACVQKAARCDGYLDCLDGSDEYRCDLVHFCEAREHLCLESPKCIPLNKTCDGK